MKTSFDKLFDKILYNERVIISEHGAKKKKTKYLLMLMLCAVFLLLILFKPVIKLIGLVPKAFKEKEVGISWNKLHKSKIHGFKNDVPIIDIGYYNQFRLLLISNIKIRKTFKNIVVCIQRKKINSPQELVYALYISFIYEILKNLLKDTKLILISGHFDRWVMVLEQITNYYGIEMSIIQHGCFQIFKAPIIKINVTGNFYYTYNFSNKAIDLYYNFKRNDVKYFHDEQSSVETFENGDKKQVIVYGCQDVNPKQNHLIIQHLIRKHPQKKIYILPHPREKITSYRKYLSKNIVVTRSKPRNVTFFVSRYSTLGLEYMSIATHVIFVNLDGVKMDFLEEYAHCVCNNLEELQLNLNQKEAKHQKPQ